MVAKKLEDLSTEELQEIRTAKKEEIIEANKEIDEIDDEFSRRKSFYSMKDKIIDSMPRINHDNMCAFWDCSEPPMYLNWISIDNETFCIRTCRKHTLICYEPRHRVLGNSDLQKLRQDIENRSNKR